MGVGSSWPGDEEGEIRQRASPSPWWRRESDAGAEAGVGDEGAEVGAEEGARKRGSRAKEESGGSKVKGGGE